MLHIHCFLVFVDPKIVCVLFVPAPDGSSIAKLIPLIT